MSDLASTRSPLRALYPDLPPRRSFTLAVGGGHRLQVREWGAADGRPVLLLHGGPGSGCSPLLWRVFDPRHYRVIAPDQRGAGASRPAGGTAHNTTTDLLADLRALRDHLGIARWLVAGGSWGATLAIAHALDAPDAVAALVLRATFLARRADIDAFFAPDGPPPSPAWRALHAAADGAPGDSLLDRLHHRLQADDPAGHAAVATAWAAWERQRSGLAPAPAAGAADALIARYRVQAHYLRAACWLDDPPLLERAAAIPAVPTLLLHGSADRVCPPAASAALAARWPHAVLHRVPGVGHDPAHPAMVDATVRALDAYARHGRFTAPSAESAASAAPAATP